MIKKKVPIFMTILMLTLIGCGKAEQERLTVYSFSGENEQLAVSNGIIVLNGTGETFVGGDLKVTGDFFADITSYSTTFYTMSGSEKDIILSNSVVDMTEGMVNVSSDLGQISGDSTFRRIKIGNTNDLNGTLYFELTTKDKYGTENVYQLQILIKIPVYREIKQEFEQGGTYEIYSRYRFFISERAKGSQLDHGLSGYG